MLFYIQSDLYNAYEKNNLVHTVQGLNSLQSPLETFEGLWSLQSPWNKLLFNAAWENKNYV